MEAERFLGPWNQTGSFMNYENAKLTRILRSRVCQDQNIFRYFTVYFLVQRTIHNIFSTCTRLQILLSRNAPRHSLLLSQFINTEAVSQDQLDFVEVGNMSHVSKLENPLSTANIYRIS